MTYRGTNVLVTGASGFIGSHVVEALVKAGAKVRALVHYNSRGDLGALVLAGPSALRKVTVISGDVRDSGCVDDAARGCAVVLHLAALISIPYSYRSPRDVVDTNVLGAVNVLEACRKHRVGRLVCTSTSEVYGTALTVPMSESHPLQAQSPYAASKASADLLALSYHRSFGLPVVVLRPFNTYGPRQSARAIIPTVISQMLSRNALTLGSLSPERDFTYVPDTVRAFLLAGLARKAEGHVVHVGSGRAIPVRQLVRVISRLLKRPMPVIRQDPKRVRPAASEVGRLIADPRRAKALLGWRAQTPLEEGLAGTIRWIRQHPEWYQWERFFV